MKIADINIYKDGSGNAKKQQDYAFKTIKQQRDVFNTVEAFINKHSLTLAGMRWCICYVNPEIEIYPKHYRAEKVDAKYIARLWPDAKWNKTQNRFDKNEIQYTATVDGVKLIITHAEFLEVKHPKVSGLVEL